MTHFLKLLTSSGKILAGLHKKFKNVFVSILDFFVKPLERKQKKSAIFYTFVCLYVSDEKR